MNILIKEFEDSIKNLLLALENEYKKIRADRANPFILDKIKIDYYGSSTKINQLSTISVVESRVLLVSPWDVSILSSIEKAILKANIGVTPQSDGKVIKIIFPPLSHERRLEISKDISKIAEDFKIRARNIRHDILNKIKNSIKDGSLTKDDMNRSEKKIQVIIENFMNKLEKIKEEKIKIITSG